MFVKYNKELKLSKTSLEDRVDTMIHNIMQKYHVKISFHDSVKLMESSAQIANVLKNYNFHNNNFCKLFKNKDGYSACCTKSIERLAEKMKRSLCPFYGRCPMGVEEFYFPIAVRSRLLGIISVGVFSSDLDQNLIRVEKGARLRNIDIKMAKRFYKKTVQQVNFDIHELYDDVTLLCDMISYFYTTVTNVKYEFIDIDEPFGIPSNNRIIAKVVSYVNYHYKEKISVSRLAELCFCNPNYLSTLFKKMMNMSIVEYINNIRIIRAKSILLFTSKSVEEISLSVGFSYPSYFISTFKKIVGCTPKEYRENNQQSDKRYEKNSINT